MNQLTSLTLNKEFKRAYYQGKFKAHPYLVTYLVKNRYPYHRVGITTPKKIGKAYQRNRARRIIKASFMTVKDQMDFDTGYDIVFVARNVTPQLKSTDLEPVMKKHFMILLRQMNQRKSKRPKTGNK